MSRWQQWYDERPVRERGLILVTLLVLILLAGFEFWIAPEMDRAARASTELRDTRAERDTLLAQQAELQQQLREDPSAELQRTLEARQRRLERIDQQIADTTGQLIPPRDMVVMLQDMLATEQSLTLESVELLAPQPIYGEAAPADDDQEATREPLLYAHEVDITVGGGYLDVLAYLERLEALDERLGWVMVDYDAGQWPDGTARIRVRTLSLEPAWLGV
ncbi:MSHA biogenesis protein MshJ [Marinobacter bryozoorum]|uniref:MSHA biogenesis protein MshJ n=1 Tax=Marinobacter bryozoorum TaxID=256324 RepID=UPI002006037C|nr:MSHA biogenesis protein MshJ [Marinobacter bryozoorum]MCK7544278.1 MSHA biogenesis protein MshJ [Marinobacter bryozoorum]